MHWNPRATALVTMIALTLQGSLPVVAEGEAKIEGTVEIPCDPSRLSEVAFVQIRAVSVEFVATLPVDPSDGSFAQEGLAEGEYELVVIGMDGQPMFSEPERLSVVSGVNPVLFTLEPPACGEEGSGPPKQGLKDWHLSLIYVGVVGLVILALDDDDDERRASPSSP